MRQKKTPSHASNLPDRPVLKHPFTLVILDLQFFLFYFKICISLPLRHQMSLTITIKETVKPKMKIHSFTHPHVDPTWTFLLLWNMKDEFLKNVHMFIKKEIMNPKQTGSVKHNKTNITAIKATVTATYVFWIISFLWGRDWNLTCYFMKLHLSAVALKTEIY